MSFSWERTGGNQASVYLVHYASFADAMPPYNKQTKRARQLGKAVILRRPDSRLTCLSLP
jgi:hypothetical protein